MPRIKPYNGVSQGILTICRYLLLGLLYIFKYAGAVVAQIALGSINPSLGRGSAYAVEKYFDSIINDID